MALGALVFALPLTYWFAAADLFGAPKIAMLRIGALAFLGLLAVGWMRTGALSVPKSPAIWAGVSVISALSTRLP